MCGTDNGSYFGMPGDHYDVCWPDHCENGTQDGGESSIDCGGPCGCEDELWCNGLEQCVGGTCVLAERDCSDGNPCTMDTCNEAANTCDSIQMSDGTPCDDGMFCIIGEMCTAGVCGVGEANMCNDGNMCTSDSCDELVDACMSTSVPDGTACDDGLFCTVGEICAGGSCGGGLPMNCSDGNECTVDSCDEGGGCVNDASAADGSLCDDGLFCNGTDTCDAGTCSIHSGNPCPVICDEVNDECN